MTAKPLNYEERLLFVTRNFVQYNGYGKDFAKASKVVKKYFKEKSLGNCRKSVEYFVKAYEEGIEFVAANKDDYWLSTRPARLAEKEKEFFAAHSEMSDAIQYGMLYWIFNWYHER